jgi:hypothetical protein
VASQQARMDCLGNPPPRSKRLLPLRRRVPYVCTSSSSFRSISARHLFTVLLHLSQATGIGGDPTDRAGKPRRLLLL